MQVQAKPEAGQKGKPEQMNQEQRDNLAKLETIRESLQKVADLFNLAGYEASPAEVYQIDQIAQIAEACQKLARM